MLRLHHFKRLMAVFIDVQYCAFFVTVHNKIHLCDQYVHRAAVMKIPAFIRGVIPSSMM